MFAQSLAEELKSKAQSLGLKTEVVDLKNYEPEDSLSEEVKIYFRICGLCEKLTIMSADSTLAH